MQTRWIRRGLYAASAVVAVVTAGSVGVAAVFARRVLTPESQRVDDTAVVAVQSDRVVLGLTDDTRVPGCYGLWLAGEGHAEVGEILDTDERAGRVTRRLGAVREGPLRVGTARWTGCCIVQPTERTLGVETRVVPIRTELGEMPAWRLDPPQPIGRWAVLVHGRGATRDECLRAVPSLHRLGITVLIPSYRNDALAPPSPDGRYSLGLSEWRDVEAAMIHAMDAGATSLLLGGWSMGGATVLQTLARSWLADVVDAAILDGPVIDWGDVLRHHAAMHRLPPGIHLLATSVMGRRATRRLAGVHEPVDVAQTDWVSRAGELRHPVLLIHSADDEFVPVGPSRALAAARPDLVRYEEWRRARHCKEWNLDPERWDRVVTEFVSAAASGP